jgi:hypothetical protein
MSFPENRSLKASQFFNLPIFQSCNLPNKNIEPNFP